MNIFVSYRHLDQDFTLRLVDALRRWGHTPWIDYEHVSAGGDWVEIINQGLHLANAVVGVLSDKSIESRMVLREWLYALENKIPLILVRLRPCPVLYPFNSIQYIDCSASEASGFVLLEKALKSPKPEDFERLITTKPAPAKTAESSKLRVTNRAAMLSKVHEFWIEGVLEPAKLGDVWLDLPAEQRPEAVQPEVKRDLHNPDFDSFSLGSGTTIVDLFRRMGNELLILGAPGSGKTIMLLELARDLIVEAQQDDKQPIPVVFNLSSWAEKHPEKLEDWLTERLFLDYGVPRKLGGLWIENGILLYLFDGLDEVTEAYRDHCVAVINTFWRKYDQIDNGIAVCSRIADYENLTTNLRLGNAILLGALMPRQADGYLANLGKGWDELRVAIPNDAVLRTFSESPLLLNVMAVAYRDTPREQIVGLSEANQKRQLFERYVMRRLREDKAPEKYPNAKTRHYLNWLGQKMAEHQQIVFQIEGLQPDWLDSERQRQQYRRETQWVPVLVGGLVGGLLVGLLGRLIFGLVIGLIFGLVFALFFGLLVWRFGAASGNLIRSIERLNWSWQKVRSELVSVVMVSLLGSLIGGLIVRILGGLVGSLFGALVGGLVLGLLAALLVGLTGNSVEQRIKPNQGIYQSARNALVGGAIGVLLVGLIVGLVLGLVSEMFGVSVVGFLGVLAFGLIVGLVFGLVVGLILGLQSGGAALIQHMFLRRILYRAGVAPLNYAEFLDYCVSRQLLRRVGGGYIFRHRILMEYFAEKES